jgi:hypothetical protein
LPPQETNPENVYSVMYGVCAAGSLSVTRPAHPGKGCPRLEKLKFPITERVSDGVKYFNTSVS